MDLRALRYFVAVYESGSVSAASKRLFIAQPSISAAIKQLEQNLSQTLFNRYARGVKATEAGDQLYPLARQLLGQANAIVDLFTTKQTKLPFRLGLIKGLGVARMSDLLKGFTTAVEQLELTLVPAEDQCDARIISEDLLHSGEHFIPMWQEEYLLALPLGHPLGLQNSLALDDLAELPMIQRGPCEGWNQLREMLQHQGVSVDIRARIQTIEYAIGLVKAGVGCAFIPVSEDMQRDKGLHLRPLAELSMKRQIGLAYRLLTPGVEALMQVIPRA